MSFFTKMKSKLTSFQIIILGFAGLILFGTLILMLPISSQTGTSSPFGKSLFTTTSAVCVTGLVAYDTASHWSYFGQAVILLMIQIGGLGVITVASFLSMLAGKKIGLMQRQTIQDSLSAPQVGGIVRLTRFLFKTSFLIEALGALLLMPVFIPEYGAKGVWMSVFHSVSAFCNAGFDLMGDKTGQFSSLTSFAGNGYLNLIICLLIVLGGIGFLTWNDFVTKKFHFREYRLQSKVILTTTLVLILVPAIIFFFVEFQKEALGRRVCMSFFQSISPRTAGFNTADLAAMTDTGKALTMILMLIGGSPGSTAGGMKTTTLTILVANAIAVFRKRQNTNCFGRRVEDSVVKNASTIFFLYLFLGITSGIIISNIEKLPMQDCLFETFSAVGTAGLTLGITQGLSSISKLILVILMFFGRVGGLTLIYAAFSNRDTTTSKYPVENITVG